MGDLSIETKNISTNDVLSGTNTEVSDLRELKIGAGSSIFFTDKEGSRWGHTTFDSAKAWIKVDGTAKFVASDGTVLMSTGATDGNFIQIINTALNTASKTILTDFTFEATDYAGAFKTGNITWSSTTGLVTGGTGIVINSRGIIGANAGTATFSIDSTTGNATFAGTLSAPSGTLGTITAGTITGATIQTAASGYRTLMTSANGLQLMNGSTQIGLIKGDAGGSMIYISADNHYFRDGSAELARFNSNGLYLGSGKRIEFASGRDITDVGYGFECDGDWVPDVDEGQSLGSYTKKWDNVFANRLYQQDSNDGNSAHCYDFGYIEMGLLSGDMVSDYLSGEDGNGLRRVDKVPHDKIRLPFKLGTVLQWTKKGLRESEKETDFAIAVASDKGLPIVLGAEPVRIIGKAKIGDAIVPSSVLGCAKAIGMGEVMIGQSVIGRCLKNKTTIGEELILVMIK